MRYGTNLTLNWTNYSGAQGIWWDEIFILAKAGASVDAAPSGDGSAFVADSTFGISSQLGTGNYVVYKGTGNSKTITGLVNDSTYYFQVFVRYRTEWTDADQYKSIVSLISSSIIVAQDGSGDYTNVQTAFNAMPSNSSSATNIFIRKGIYYEKILLASNKINVSIRGENRDSTILTYDDYAGRPDVGGTQGSYSVAIDANDFTAQDITFQNTVPHIGSDKQAVALRTNGDRQAYINCKMLGYQDTYYTQGQGRIYNKGCFIEGTVDFIFGRAITVFDSCTIHEIRNNGTLTAASTEQTYKFGYVFLNCNITADPIGFDGAAITSFYLGRPWQNFPQTVFIKCFEPASLNPAGWLAWNVTPALYAEYQCPGPGSLPEQRVNWSTQLTDSAAATFTIENIFSVNSGIGSSNWIPPSYSPPTFVKQNEAVQIPSSFALHQNYPNPFNPVTTISYDLPKPSMVSLKVYDIYGREIATLVNGVKIAGIHLAVFNGISLPSGTYFARLKTGTYSNTIKLILLK